MKHSLPARVTAVGFIIFVLFGNLWLAKVLLGAQPDSWVAAGFTVGLAIAALGGLGLALLALRRLFSPPPEQE